MTKYTKQHHAFNAQRQLLNLILAILVVFVLVLYMQLSWSYERREVRRSPLLRQSRWAEQDKSDSTHGQQKFRNLIVVAGHSVIKSGCLDGVDKNDDRWWLLDYQRETGMPEAFVSHIAEGIRLAKEDQQALLLFSGGQTRPNAGPVSEALSYFQVAEHLGWTRGEVGGRIGLEEYARDSFENVLFSLCRFNELAGFYPDHVTVVGFEFKRQRFEELHRLALRIEPSKFHYRGVNPNSNRFQRHLHALERWEKSVSLEPFRTDPYGCREQVLVRKRLERNPFARSIPYELTCPEMKHLLSYCSTKIYPKGLLPWDL